MVRPWFTIAVEASPLGPVATGALLGLALLAVNLALYAGERLDLLLYFPTAIGYLLAASALCARATRRDLRDLRPRLACSDAETASLEARSGRYGRRLLGVATAGGLLMFAQLAYFLGAARDPELPAVWQVALLSESALFWCLAVPIMTILVTDAARFRRLGAERLQPRLFDREGLAPFSRVGLRGALVILGIFGLRIAFYAISAPRMMVLANLLPMALAAALAASALLLATSGARERIRDAKRRELARIRGALSQHGFTPGAPGETLEPRPPRDYLDLLEYRERVSEVREWPIDTPALLRFLLYLAIPAAGWVGGALVERTVSRFLD